MSSAGRKDQPAGGKSRGYASLSLGPSYSSSQNETRTGNRKGTMQTLGKIAPTRRMPGPAQVRSLRSEHEGNDPTVNLVPQGGGGWKSSTDEEEKKEKTPHACEGEKPRKPLRPPEHFRSDFPSLEEQEKMTKREWEELERRRRDESRRINQDRDGSQSPSTDRPQYLKYPEHAWDHQPPLNYVPPPGHTHGYPPTGPGRGYPPPPTHPHSHHPNQHHPQFFVPPPRQGMPPDYSPYPLHAHSRGYPPHPGFGHHGPYPHSYHPNNPYEMSDPYHLSPRDRRGSGRGRSGRPPTVKDHDLQNMDADDDDEGWAGHHEEVDYSKEVVFEDSSDEESNGDKRDQLVVGHQHSEQSGKENKPPPSDHKRHDVPSDRWKDHSTDSAIGDSRLNVRSHRGSPPHSGSPILAAGPQIYQQGPPHYSSHHEPYPHHPQRPYLQGSVYPPYPTGHPLRAGAFGPSPSKLRRVGGERDGEHEGRHNFNPHWEQDSDHRHKRRLGSTQDEQIKDNHPRVMKHSREDRTQQGGRSDHQGPAQGSVGTEEKSQPSPCDQHSAATVEHDQPSPSSQHTGGQHPATPQPRSQPKKIMIRNLSEQVSSGDQSQGRTHSHLQTTDSRPGGQRDRGGSGSVGKGINQTLPSKPKMAWGTTNETFQVATPPPQPLTPTDEPLQQQKVTWSIDDRGPINTPKTLYEPEGRTSQEKFKKYHRSVSGGETTNIAGTGSRGRISSTGSDKGGKGDGSEDGPFQGDGERQLAASHGEQRDENTDREQPLERTRTHPHFERQQQREGGKRRSGHSSPLPAYTQTQQKEEEPFVDDHWTSGRQDGRRPRSCGQEERREKEDAWKQDRKGRSDQQREDLRKDEPRRNNRDRKRGSRDEPVESRRVASHRSRGEHDASRAEHDVPSRGRGVDQNVPPKGKRRENDLPPRAMGEQDASSKGRSEHGAFSKGKGEHDAPSRGKGEYDVLPRGRGEHDVLPRGRGGHDTPPRGKGDYDALPRGKGEHDGLPKGKGEHSVSRRGRGEYDDPPRGKREHDALARGRGEQDASLKSREEHSTSSRAREHNPPSRGKGEHNPSSRGWGDHEGVPKGRGRREVAPREMEDLEKPDPNQREQTRKGSLASKAKGETLAHESWRAEKGERRSNQHNPKPGDNRKENQQRSTQEQGPVNYAERKNDEQWPQGGRKTIDRQGEIAESRRGRKGRGGPRNRSNAQNTVPGGRSGQNQPEAPPHSPQSVDFERRGSDDRRNSKGGVGPGTDARGRRKPRGEEGRQLRRVEQDHRTELDRAECTSVGREPNLAEKTKRKDVNSPSLSMQTDSLIPIHNEPDLDPWDRPPSHGGSHKGGSRGRGRSSRREQDRGGGKGANQPKRTEDRDHQPSLRGRGERGGHSRQGQRPSGRQHTKNDQPPSSHWREDVDVSRQAVWSGIESVQNSAEVTTGKGPAGNRQRSGNVVPREKAEPTQPPASQVVYQNMENVSSASDWEDEEELPHNPPQHRRHTGVPEARASENYSGPPTPLISPPPSREDRTSRRGGRLGNRGSGVGRGMIHGDRRSGPASSNRSGSQGRSEGSGTRGETSVGRGGRRGEQSVTDSGRPGSGGTFDTRQPHPMSTAQDPKRQEDLVASAASSRKGQDITNYDLNSHNVYVVDHQEESHGEEQTVLSPAVGDSDGFTVVISKKERKENNREEKRKHEVEKRRHEDDHQHSHRQRSSQSARSLGGRGEVGVSSKTSQPSQTGWGGAGEFATSKSVDSIWSQTEKSTTVWSPAQPESLSLVSFGAVGDKPTREQPLPSGIPPFSTALLQSGAYNMWSMPSDFFPSPSQGVPARKGGMLQAAIDSSMIAATASIPPTNQASPTPLTQILIEPTRMEQEVLVKPSRQIESGKSSGGHHELPLQLQQQRDPRAAGSVGPPKHSRIEPEGRGQGRGGGVTKGGEQQDRFYTPPHARQEDLRSNRIASSKGPPTSTSKVSPRPSSAGGRPQKVL